MRLLIIHGANLNMLGKRGDIYGDFSYDDLQKTLDGYCKSICVAADFFVTNHEGEIIDRIHKADYDALIINAGAYSHTSLAIADALDCVNVPKIEVHITNIHARNRHTSLTGAVVDGVICGFKTQGYIMAINHIKSLLNLDKPKKN